MKTIIALFLFSLSYGQVINFKSITTEGRFSEYISREGNSIKTGDTLTIGYPRDPHGFIYITQGSMAAAPWLANKKVVVHSIKSIGTKKQGYKVYIAFKGYGLVPVLIDYEAAADTGEIKKT